MEGGREGDADVGEERREGQAQEVRGVALDEGRVGHPELAPTTDGRDALGQVAIGRGANREGKEIRRIEVLADKFEDLGLNGHVTVGEDHDRARNVGQDAGQCHGYV